MAYTPIAFTAPNYRDYGEWWAKAYIPGTTTPKSMATDSTLSTLIAKAQVNADGFFVSAGSALIIPYIDGLYDLWLFPTEADADSNNTAEALRLANNLSGGFSGQDFDLGLINDLSQTYNFGTVALYSASTITFPTGKRIYIGDYDAYYTVTSDPLTHNGINHQNAAGVVIEFIPEDNQIRMEQAGILYDNSTIHQIMFIADYANEKGINVELTNEAATQVKFDDEFQLSDTRLVSKGASYLYYDKPVSGGVADDVAVLRFGNELTQARPAYFETTEQFRIGEKLRFEPLQGYGEVMFQVEDRCYFKWSRPSGESEVPPTTGTVTGSVSGSVQAYTESTVDSSSVVGGDRNAGWDKVYLRTDVTDVATSHIQAVGIQVSGLRNGRSFARCGDMTVEGFQTAGYWIANYFGHVDGTLEASKCADGHIFTDNNNEFLLAKYIGTCGTEYDAVERFRGYVSFSAGFHVENMDLEFERGVAQFCVSACKNFRVDSLYTERDEDNPLFYVRGGAALEGVATSVQDNSLFRYAWTTGCSIGSYYSLDAYCMRLGSCIDGLEVGQITLLRKSTTTISENWASVIEVDGTNIKGVKLNGINSNSWDVNRKFPIDMSYPKSTIKFHDSNYETCEYVFSQIKPMADTKLYAMIPFGDTTYFYVDNASIFVKDEASINTRVRITTSEAQLTSFDLDNGSDDYAYASADQATTGDANENPQNAISYITIEAWDLPAVLTPVTYTATIKKLTVE